MLYTYTSNSVGGKIRCKETPPCARKNLHFGQSHVAVMERNDGKIVIEVQEGIRTTKIISNVELEFRKHASDDGYYPVFK